MFNLKSYVFLLVGIIILTSCKPEEKESLADASVVAIDRLVTLDVKLSQPQPGDWLDTHQEPGQTFEKYIQEKPVTPTEQQNKIYLQPIGKFSKVEEKLVTYTADYLQLFFGLETLVLPVLSDVIVPISARRRTDAGDQLQTGFIMDYLQREIPNDGIVIMAITPNDLYPSSKYNFVFGQARTKKRVGVSSFNRFADVMLDSTNYSLCLSRLIKTSSHEIGHMFTCLHCIHAVCLMNGSNGLWESDLRPNRLCSDCLRKLHWNLRFEIKPRLEGIALYFKKHHLENEYKQAMQDLSVID